MPALILPRRKAVILVTIIGILLVVVTLAYAVLSLMTQESQLAEGKIKRIRAFYAAEAGRVKALEELRKTGAANPASFNLNNCVVAVSNSAATVEGQSVIRINANATY